MSTFTEEMTQKGRGLTKTFCQTFGHLLLSNREIESLYYLMRGMTAKQIATVMELSPRTVESHMQSIKTKLTCRRRSEVISKVFNDPVLYRRVMQIATVK